MKALYITSVEAYSGKTALCLGLGKRLQGDGYKIGYLKPMSTQPWRTPQGELTDEDAVFVRSMLGLDVPTAALCPVVVTQTTLRARLKGAEATDMMGKIKAAAESAGQGKDALLLEGGASLREGYAMGLSNLQVANLLGAPALVMVSYRGEMQAVDDALTARFRLGDQLLGIIFNRVPDQARPFVNDYCLPFLNQEGIAVFGTLPSVPRLSALSMAELVDLLDAQVLTRNFDPNALVENFLVGAMTTEAALSRFRRQKNKAVITGGDRTDIQLAALETSTAALILTGNLHPSPLIIQQAESFNVPILLVAGATMETTEIIERTAGKTRLGQPKKLEAFMQLMSENIDVDGIYAALGLG
jgi:BioD-like phosphotransacetylase family protein